MSTALAREASKWFQTMKVNWSEMLVYRMNFFLLVIGPALVFFFVKFSLWTSIFQTTGQDVIQGYTQERMLLYQFWVLIVSLTGQGHNSMELAEDIRHGRISTYLIYPFDFWQFHTAAFIAFQITQLFVVAVTLGVSYLAGFIGDLNPMHLVQGLAFSSIVGTTWFCLQFLIGLLAFWLEETWVLRVMILTVSQFLSGAVLPLEIYPDWFVAALMYTPFPYLTYVPAQLFMGEFTGNFIVAISILLFWMALLAGLATWIWKRGMRLYTAAGM